MILNEHGSNGSVPFWISIVSDSPSLSSSWSQLSLIPSPSVSLKLFDIVTLFKFYGIDPDINRIDFCNKGLSKEDLKSLHIVQHNALLDAKIIKRCYECLTAHACNWWHD